MSHKTKDFTNLFVHEGYKESWRLNKAVDDWLFELELLHGSYKIINTCVSTTIKDATPMLYIKDITVRVPIK